MSQDRNTINCPKCGEEIDVNAILYSQVSAQLKKQYSDELQQEREKQASQVAELQAERERLEADKKQQQQSIEREVESELKKLKTKYRAEVAAEQADALSSLQEELEEKSSKIKALNQSSIALEKLKREMSELEESLQAKAEKELNRQLLASKKQIQEEAAANHELKFKELEKQLADQKRLTEEMQRKQEQGSMQTQGEVQELGIEEWLSAQFPLDLIQEIKKGERGADCLQIVHTRARQNCGTIYYESKRTKAFQPTWIDKFKADIRDKNADIGVLVTAVMPPDMERFGLKDGIWICSFEEFKGLCTVLRESVIQLSAAIVTQENRGDKMGMLYDFLTGNEFRLQIEAIVSGFTQMSVDLESERRSMRAIWKKREKQIDNVLLNTTDMYGSVKGIAGSALQSVPLLELPDTEEGD